MNDEAPVWAAPTIEIAPSAITDQQMDRAGGGRLLFVDWENGMLSLSSGAITGGRRVSCWPMPRIPAAEIYGWLPVILPYLRTAGAGLRQGTSGSRFTDEVQTALEIVSMEIDSFTLDGWRRPAWAAPTIELAPPAMTDQQMDQDLFARMLVADWENGTLSLRSYAGLDSERVNCWPVPRIPAAEIYRWLPTVLPLLRTAAAGLRGGQTRPRFIGEAKDAIDAVFPEVDKLTIAWCARPAVRGQLSICAGCGQEIEQGTRGTHWIRASAAADDIACPGDPLSYHRPRTENGQSICIRGDYRPYHDCVFTGSGDLYTGHCICGSWSNTDPGLYSQVLLDFDRHANAPLAHLVPACRPREGQAPAQPTPEDRP